MKILITGGCGFVGSNLAIYFKEKKIGTKIESLDNLSRKGTLLNLNRLKKKNIKNFKINISNNKAINKLPKYDLIVDCCAEAAVEASKSEIDRVFSTNLIGTFNVLKKCARDKTNIIFLRANLLSIISAYRRNHDPCKRSILLLLIFDFSRAGGAAIPPSRLQFY